MMNQIMQQLLNIVTNVEKKVIPIGHFSVVLDDKDKARKLVSYMDRYNISSKDKTILLEEGVTSLAFFYDIDHDVTTVSTITENVVRDLTPRYFLSEDFWTVIDLIKTASDEKKALRKELNVKNKSLLALRKLKKVRRDEQNIIDMLHQTVFSVCTPVTPKPEPTRNNFVGISDHYFQVGNDIFFKNPKDTICVTTN